MTTIYLQGWAGDAHLPVTITVHLDRKCSTCDGTGNVYSEEWRAWNKLYDKAREDAERRGALEQINGKWVDPKLFDLEEQMEHLGPEEPLCEECDGCGSIASGIGSQLLEFYDAHRGQR
jgi:hypothetical protein